MRLILVHNRSRCFVTDLVAKARPAHSPCDAVRMRLHLGGSWCGDGERASWCEALMVFFGYPDLISIHKFASKKAPCDNKISTKTRESSMRTHCFACGCPMTPMFTSLPFLQKLRLEIVRAYSPVRGQGNVQECLPCFRSKLSIQVLVFWWFFCFLQVGPDIPSSCIDYPIFHPFISQNIEKEETSTISQSSPTMSNCKKDIGGFAPGVVATPGDLPLLGSERGRLGEGKTGGIWTERAEKNSDLKLLWMIHIGLFERVVLCVF